MAQIEISAEVKAARDVVFQAFGDFRNAARHVSGIDQLEVLGEDPIGIGTRFRETRTMFKRQMTEEMEITGWEPGRSYTVEGDTCGCRFTTRFDFDGYPDGTQVRVTAESRPINLLAKLLSPLSGLMMGPMKKCIQQDIEDLRLMLESPNRAK